MMMWAMLCTSGIEQREKRTGVEHVHHETDSLVVEGSPVHI